MNLCGYVFDLSIYGKLSYFIQQQDLIQIYSKNEKNLRHDREIWVGGMIVFGNE